MAGPAVGVAERGSLFRRNVLQRPNVRQIVTIPRSETAAFAALLDGLAFQRQVFDVLAHEDLPLPAAPLPSLHVAAATEMRFFSRRRVTERRGPDSIHGAIARHQEIDHVALDVRGIAV